MKQLNRLQQILIVALVVQLALAAFVLWPTPAASEDSGPLLPVTADQVTQLTIADNDGNRLVLAEQGDGWVLPEAGNYPVETEKVTALLEKIEKIQTNRLVAQTESSQARLQVADNDFNRKLELTLADGSSQELLVGSAGGASATHVRAADQPQVFLTNEVNSWDINATPASWIDTLYFTAPQTATVALTLENQNGTFAFEQTEDGSWTMAGLSEDETFNESQFTGLLNQVQNVRMTAPLGIEADASFGLDDPQATVTLQTANETYTLQVGATRDEDNSYVFKASNSPYYVTVAQFTGSALTDKSRADFIAAPPADEAEENAEPQ